MVRRLLSIVCLGAIVLLNSGCGGGGPEGSSDIKLAEGGGTVTYNGSPLAGASVTFIPAAGPIASGTTDLSGKFKLSTGALSGVAVGKCKVTVTAFESGGKPAAAAVTAGPTTKPADPEEMRKKMNLGSQMREVEGAGASGAKSLIPDIYGKPDKTTLSFQVETDAAKNQFKIDLKD